MSFHTDLGDHDKLREEAYETEGEEEPFPPACPAHYCGKHVYSGRHHHLHGNKLYRGHGMSTATTCMLIHQPEDD